MQHWHAAVQIPRVESEFSMTIFLCVKKKSMRYSFGACDDLSPPRLRRYHYVMRLCMPTFSFWCFRRVPSAVKTRSGSVALNINDFSGNLRQHLTMIPCHHYHMEERRTTAQQVMMPFSFPRVPFAPELLDLTYLHNVPHSTKITIMFRNVVCDAAGYKSPCYSQVDGDNSCPV